MLRLETYHEHESHLPLKGKFIIAQFDKDSVIVYQAFNDAIAKYAVDNQRFGGDSYDFGRITWLKPSFLWMMYYSGWARNENQENVLAIRVSKQGFEHILRHAVMSKFVRSIHSDQESWEKQLAQSGVHLRWESYHDLFGDKTERKAARIGLSGQELRRFNEEWILEIRNITDFVKEQQALVKASKLDKVKIPRERAYAPEDLAILRKIDATTISL
jgi:hypothetical protein